MRRLKLAWIALAGGFFVASVETVFLKANSPAVAQSDEVPQDLDDLEQQLHEPLQADLLPAAPLEDIEPLNELGDEMANDDARSIDQKQVFLELAEQKADLLNADELQQEILKLRHELAELRATLKLRTAELQLQQIIKEFPKSLAAERAQLMLRGGNRPAESFPHAPRIVPIPESNPDDVFRPAPNSESGYPKEFLDDRVLPQKTPQPLKPARRTRLP